MTEIAAPDLRAESESAHGNTLSDRLAIPWLFPLLAFAATWVLTAATWHVSNAVYHAHLPWTTWLWFGDSGFYRDIASVGYGHPVFIVPHGGGTPFTATGRSPFFPLFPALIRLVSYATLGHFLVADVVAQVFAGAASAVAVWTLAARIRDRRTADRAVLLYCACPGAMTFGMLYPEPLAVALAAGSLLAVLSRKWLVAGLLAMLATAAHPTLTVLIPVLGIIALHAIWTKRDWRSLIAPVVAPLGVLGYFAYYGHRYHDYLFWFRIERAGWHQHIDWGIHELHVITWTDPGTTAHPVFNALVIIMFWASVIGIGLLIAARVPWPVTLYTAAVFLSCVVSSSASPRPRFVLTMFGIFIGAGAKLPRYLFWPTLVVSAGLLAFVIGWWPHNLPPSP